MKYKELELRFNGLKSMNQVTRISKETVEEVYEGLITLKDSYCSSYFEFETIEEYRESEDLKIKIAEEILLCEMSRNALFGIPNRKLEEELDDFYATNERVHI